jgi:ketosteroid isomerase-like protein
MYVARVMPVLLIVSGLGALFIFGRESLCQAEDSNDAKKAIRKVLDNQVIAWNKGDLPGFMEGYWKSDALRYYSGKDITSGWQASLDRLRKKYQGEGKKMGKLTFSDVEIELLGPEAAMVRGQWEVDMGKEKVNGLFTLVMRKLAPGWRTVHDHSSS